MAEFTLEQRIRAPRARVFELATDVARMPEFVRGIARVELLTDGPLRVGTRWRETRRFGKREATEELELTAFDPPRAWSVGSETMGCRFRFEFELEEEPGGGATTLRLRCGALPRALLARVLSFLLGPMLAACRRATEGDLRDLAAACEEAPPR